MLVPDGAREATSRISRIVASSTGSGRKARTERRDVIASSTIAASSSSGAFLSRASMSFRPGSAAQIADRPAFVRHCTVHRRPGK